MVEATKVAMAVKMDIKVMLVANWAREAPVMVVTMALEMQEQRVMMGGGK